MSRYGRAWPRGHFWGLTFTDAVDRVANRVGDALGSVTDGTSHASEDAACGGKGISDGQIQESASEIVWLRRGMWDERGLRRGTQKGVEIIEQSGSAAAGRETSGNGGCETNCLRRIGSGGGGGGEMVVVNVPPCCLSDMIMPF
jgi:hypothetical protein